MLQQNQEADLSFGLVDPHGEVLLHLVVKCMSVECVPYKAYL
jgi:hypothetical protein